MIHVLSLFGVLRYIIEWFYKGLSIIQIDEVSYQIFIYRYVGFQSLSIWGRLIDITVFFLWEIEFVFLYIIEYFWRHLSSIIHNFYDFFNSFDYFQEAEFVEMGGTLDYREELAKQLKEDMAGAKYDTI